MDQLLGPVYHTGDVGVATYVAGSLLSQVAVLTQGGDPRGNGMSQDDRWRAGGRSRKLLTAGFLKHAINHGRFMGYGVHRQNDER